MLDVNTTPHLSGLAQAMVLDGLISEETARMHLQHARDKKLTFANYILENSKIPPLDIARCAAKSFGVPMLDINNIDREYIPTNLVSEELIQRHFALPILKRGDQLFLAVADPTQHHVLNEIKFHTGLNTRNIVVEGDKLRKLIDHVIAEKENAALSAVFDDNSLDDLSITSGSETKNDDEERDPNDDAPVVRYVNKILLDAVKKDASDIHFEPYEKSFRIRFRVDGMLTETAAPPFNLANRITSRLKIMAQLDISERRVPQDGRFMMNLSRKHTIDFRVNTCPTVGGEKVVMRILDPTMANMGIDALGFSHVQRERFLKAIHQPQGMVLVTGPTGSGKTVSLYTALNILNTGTQNISTAEDPVEIKVSGINQVNINNKAGLTFASALRAFLRQDPDIIMVGEIRDLETAEIGIKAAQTGHMVLSTLHTNSAPETLTRLLNMGVASYNIASSVSLIVAQRLARRLCPKCKQAVSIPDESLIELGFQESDIGKFEIFKAVGCDHCTSGYKGRVGLYEVMPVTKQIGEIIMRGGNSLDILEESKTNQVVTIRESGLEKVREGISSLDEINRVTKD
jgi:type IV pilus assembly protein PilB